MKNILDVWKHENGREGQHGGSSSASVLKLLLAANAQSNGRGHGQAPSQTGNC
jgi:hypothetical protein